MTFFWTLLILAVIAGIYMGVGKPRRIARGQGPRVVVETVKGERAAQRRIRFMLDNGYELQGQGSRKVMWSPLTGVFTRKQKHTLTGNYPLTGQNLRMYYLYTPRGVRYAPFWVTGGEH